MTRLARLLATVAIAAGAAAVAPYASAAADTTPPTQVYAVAGSAHYLVYLQSAASGGSTVHVMNPKGRQRQLGEISVSSDVYGIQLSSWFQFSLVGSTLTATAGDNDSGPGSRDRSTPVYWWNLATRAEGTVELTPGQTWDSSLPDGILIDVQHGKHPDESFYQTVSFDGRAKALANPFRTGAALGAGPSGYVDLAGAPKDMNYRPYSGGRTIHLADPAKNRDPETIECEDPLAHFEDCQVRGDDDTDVDLMVPLSGGKVITFAYPGGIAADIGGRIGYGDGALHFISRSGHRSTSKVRGFSEVAAFGQLIFGNHQLTTIEALASSHSAPKVLVSST